LTVGRGIEPRFALSPSFALKPQSLALGGGKQLMHVIAKCRKKTASACALISSCSFCAALVVLCVSDNLARVGICSDVDSLEFHLSDPHFTACRIGAIGLHPERHIKGRHSKHNNSMTPMTLHQDIDIAGCYGKK
jgi:hypothetical protein